MSDKGNNATNRNYDPGWNDPPKLPYNTTQPVKTKLNLNKRIAFPLQSNTPQSSKPTAVVQPSTSSHPPIPMALSSQPRVAIVPPMSHINSPPVLRVPPLEANSDLVNPDQGSNEDSTTEISPDATREFCINTFQNFAGKIPESTSIRPDEVQRRINLLNQMWLSGTLTSSVHRKLYKIAKGLENHDFNEAIENHRALVVDHSNVCVAWGAALRQLILTIHNSGTEELPTAQDGNMANILVPSGILSDISNTQSENSENVQNI